MTKETITQADVGVLDVKALFAPKTAAELLASAPIKFAPVDDFYSEEFRSQYCKGLQYTLKPDAEFNDKLAACMETWLADGKITLVDPSKGSGATGVAGVSGTGVVT